MKNFRSTNSTVHLSSLTSFNQGKSKKNYLIRSRRAGRNNQGIITSRHRGGGKNCRRIASIDFLRKKLNLLGKVRKFEYDGYRNRLIALISYPDATFDRILPTVGIKVGSTVIRRCDAAIENGNRVPLWNIPIGTIIHNIQINATGKIKIARSPGSYCTIVSRDLGKVKVMFPSGTLNRISQDCWCTIGSAMPKARRKSYKKLEKAGRLRWIGVRPTVRGSAINPVDHPHGGGEGRSPIGRKRPINPWRSN